MILLIITLVLSFFIVLPFVNALIAAIIIAYIFYPVYRFLVRWIKNSTASSFIVTIIILLIILVPLVFLINSTASAIQGISKIQDFLDEGFPKGCKSNDNTICSGIDKLIENYNENPRMKLTVDSSLNKLRQGIFTYSTNFILTIPRLVLSIFIMFFAIYYLFKDGPGLVDYIKNLLPIKDIHKKSLISKFDDVLYAVLYGTFITALIQGVLAGLGFYLFGFKSFFLLGVLTIIAAMIPFLGPPVVWVPAVLFKVIEGVGLNNNIILWKAIGMAVYALLVVGLIDNFLRPKIIGKRSNVHPVVILIGIFGGIYLLGPIGLVAGPLILALTETMIEIFKKEKDGIGS